MKKYQVIVSDPPWMFNDVLTMEKTKRGAAANYPLLDTSELCALKVKQIADPKGCVLVLWSIGSLLDDAMRVMKAWGFSQKQIFVWVKTKKQPLQNLKSGMRKLKRNKTLTIENIEKEIDAFDLNETMSFGMGRLFRQTHEICLIGINSTQIYKQLANKSQRSVCFNENKKHSSKPENLQDYLDLMFPKEDKLEMFARRKRAGWDVIGNEVCGGEDIRDSIERLILANGSQGTST